MLNKVHHVTYVVESISDMAVYMETVSYTHLTLPTILLV